MYCEYNKVSCMVSVIVFILYYFRFLIIVNDIWIWKGRLIVVIKKIMIFENKMF